MKQLTMEHAAGTEQIRPGKRITETNHRTRALWTISRWESEADRKADIIYPAEKSLALFGTEQFSVIPGNILVNSGINQLFTILCSTGGTRFDNANSLLLVGDDTVTAEAAAQTSLQAVRARPAWAASTVYALNIFVRPVTVGDGDEFVYQCTTAGTSAAAAPVWPTVDGATVTDGTVVWTARRRIFTAPMMVGFPTFGTLQRAVWKSRFEAGMANYPWREFAVRSAMVILNRRVSNQGEKVSGHIWELELTITLS